MAHADSHLGKMSTSNPTITKVTKGNRTGKLLEKLKSEIIFTRGMVNGISTNSKIKAKLNKHLKNSLKLIKALEKHYASTVGNNDPCQPTQGAKILVVDKENSKTETLEVKSAQPVPAILAPAPVPAAEFIDIVGRLDETNFADHRLQLLQSLSDQNFSVVQLVKILDRFPFADDRIKAVLIIYPRLVDKSRLYQVYSTFPFSTDRERLKKEINQLQKPTNSKK